MHEMQEMQVLSLGWGDPLEKEMATHYSIAWKISWTEKPSGLQSTRSSKELDTMEHACEYKGQISPIRTCHFSKEAEAHGHCYAFSGTVI